ncbi:unnamed protein product, partial [Didymodactylos carnosus]
FGVVLHNYFPHFSPSTVQIFNENFSVEQALRNIPTCAAHDRAAQRALLTALKTWALLARKHNLQYWISYGTLIGYVQRGGLLPHDHDVDVSMMEQDTSQLVALASLINSNLTSLDSNIYKLIVHPQWHIVGWFTRSYFRSQGVNFISPNARFIHQKTAVYVDIWPVYNYHPGQSENSTNTSSILSEYDGNYDWKVYARNWTFPLNPCKYSGIHVWCPAQPKELVAAFYGRSAVYKSDTSCVNGTWRSN